MALVGDVSEVGEPMTHLYFLGGNDPVSGGENDIIRRAKEGTKKFDPDSGKNKKKDPVSRKIRVGGETGKLVSGERGKQNRDPESVTTRSCP